LEFETRIFKEKSLKRNTAKTLDVDMEDVQTSKKVKIQSKGEEEMQVNLTEETSDQMC